MSLDGCDTVDGIELHLQTGISGLRHLVAARKRYKGANLRQWVILGHWWLDSTGNMLFVDSLALHNGSAEPIDMRPRLARVVDWSHLKAIAGLGALLRWTNVILPEADQTCPVCGRGWTLENAHDNYYDPMPEAELRHKKCAAISQRVVMIEKYEGLLRRAGFPMVVLHEVPNRYSGDPMTPWFSVSNPYGADLTIGWRKNVINIEWPASVTVDWGDEAKATTNGPGMIHAWGWQKAERYLTSIATAMKGAK